MWPEMPVLFITSRDPGGGEGGSPAKMKAGAFSLALLLVPFGPLALKLRKKISVLGDPLSLRSMEIENFKRRYLRYLKR